MCPKLQRMGTHNYYFSGYYALSSNPLSGAKYTPAVRAQEILFWIEFDSIAVMVVTQGMFTATILKEFVAAERRSGLAQTCDRHATPLANASSGCSFVKGLRSWKEEAHDGAAVFSLAAAEAHVAAALLDEALGHPESDAGADVGLGGEERGEEPGLDFRRHAAAVIGQGEADTVFHAVGPVLRLLRPDPDAAAAH